MLKKLSVITLSSSIMLTGISSTYSEKAHAETTPNEDENVTFLLMEEFTLPDDPALNDTEEAASTRIIHTGKYIKKQGYMTNAQLRKYVKYVDARKDQMGIATMVVGFAPYFAGVPQTILMQFLGSNSSFEIVKKKAYAGYGMGWCHMYSTGTKSLTVIPRRDFSKAKIVYKK